MEDGKFEIPDVIPGQYQLRLERQGFSQPTLQEVTVSSGGCGWVDSAMQTNGRIRMLVTDRDGRPVPKLPVWLLYEAPGARRDALFELPETNAAGIFDVSGLPSASYLIAVNPTGPSDPDVPYPTTYFPGKATEAEATRVLLRPNEQRVDLQLRLPDPIPTRRIHVRVTNKNGAPAVGATVFAKKGTVEHADNNGMATILLLAGFESSVEAWQEFDTGDGTKPWVDWKRWQASMPIPGKTGDATLEVRFEQWKRNGDLVPHL